eukprot:TRINITY_DN2002_c0_g1_i1.p1 TRINITY_DN2002_c0_g1~~TRINITY_DN2002_c0_g1_i1.p1  ORF type:complete len:143 (+),score=29.76 TRINITY_DN2002_c0_g1_i1:120-548(+)
MEKLCQVCGKESWKYKCPQCQTKYCSIPCFRKHKETCIVADKVDKVSEEGADKRVEDGEMGRSSEPLRVEAGLFSTEQLHRLKQSPEITRLLSLSRTQQWIKDVSVSENPHKTLRLLRENPDMEAFTQLCLSIVQQQEDHEQ